MGVARVGLAFGDFEFKPESAELRQRGSVVQLSQAGAKLLGALLERPGAPVTKAQLMRAAWGDQVHEGRLTVAMAELRKTLGAQEDGWPIATIYKVGYRFVADVARARASAPQPVAEPRPPLYVGRNQLSASMLEALEQARDGRGRVLLLIGEPGIGKTRAVEMLERALPEWARIAWGYCRESGDTPPLWPWHELRDAILSQSDPAPLHSSVSEAWAHALLDTDTTRHEAFERAASLIIETTSDAPWVLVLDDLHRADAASLELLLRVADRIGSTRLFLIATLRAHQPAESDRHQALLAQLSAHGSCHSIRLERLSQQDVASFVAAQVDDPTGEIGLTVYQTSEGNPFFMTELTRQIGASGAVASEALRVPHAALDLMRQRVAGIDQELRGLLSVCAVIGRTISLPLLAEVLGREPAEVRAQLRQALRRDVLLMTSEVQLRFSHELIRSALYDGMVATERREWHARVAAALEQRREHGFEIPASEVAFHCHAALPVGDLRLSIRVCREAADDAASVFGATDVAHFTNYALEALRLLNRPSVRLRMSLLYGLAIYSRPYSPSMYARCVHELIELAQRCASGEMLARAGALLNAHPRLLPLPAAAAVPARALAWLSPDAHGLCALALASQAVQAPTCFEAARCLPLVRRAGELAATALSELVASSPKPAATSPRQVLRASARGRNAFYTALLHQLYLDAADPERTRQVYARLEELARRSPAELSTLPIDLAFHRAAVALGRGAPAQATSALEAARERARQLTHTELGWHSERALALVRVERYADHAAGEALRALHQQAAAQRIPGTATFVAHDQQVYLGLATSIGASGLATSIGASGLATRAELDAASRAALSPAAEDTPALWSMKLSGLVAAGVHAHALDGLRRIPAERLRDLPVDGDYLGTLGQLVRCAIALGETSYYPILEELLTPHEAAFSAQLLAGYSGAVAQLLGMLAQAAGRHPDAIQRFERAAERTRAAGLCLRGLEARLGLARSLLALGRTEPRLRALALAGAVHEEAEQTLASGLRREAKRLLRGAARR